MTEQLLEAVDPASFHSRVTGLEMGEVAMLRGGVAVKHVALEDGRAAYKIGRPRSYGSGETRFDEYGDTHRDAESATRAAFRHSAESTDPESIGGTTRLSRYGDISHGGEAVRIEDWTTSGDPIVRAPVRPGTRTVKASALSRREAILGEVLREEVGKPGTNWKQVSPENRKKVNPLVKHYMKEAHPFSACVRDNTKRFGPERAKRVCAVVKDMGEKSTKWRKGRKKVTEAMLEEAAREFAPRLLKAAHGDVDGLQALFLSEFLAESGKG